MKIKIYPIFEKYISSRVKKTRAMAIEAKATPDLNKKTSPSLSWKESPEVRKLLDALVAILSKEYIQVAKENPTIFSE